MYHDSIGRLDGGSVVMGGEGKCVDRRSPRAQIACVPAQCLKIFFYVVPSWFLRKKNYSLKIIRLDGNGTDFFL
jgi:hypothetical protein